MTSIEARVLQPYKYGFETTIASDVVRAGLNEDIIRLISQKKGEPAFLLEWRLKADRHWVTMSEAKWGNITYGPIHYQAIHYYAAPKQEKSPDSLSDGDPKLLDTLERLGIPPAQPRH